MSGNTGSLKRPNETDLSNSRSPNEDDPKKRRVTASGETTLLQATLSNTQRSGHSTLERSLGPLVDAALKVAPVAVRGSQFVGESSQNAGRKATTADDFVSDAYTALDTSTTARDKKGLAELQEALESVPHKEAYLEAMQRVPVLVEMESPGIRFLMREDFDPKAAATRLVTYWRKRKDMFGKRAFLPMDMSGEGALNEDDIALVNTKYIAVLPPDMHGHRVLYYDREQIPNEVADDMRLRVAFYWLQTFAEDIGAQEQGIVCITILNSVMFRRGHGGAGKAIQVLRDAMPIRLRWLHLIQRPIIGTRPVFVSILPLAMHMLGKLLWKSTTVHVAETKEDILAELHTHGLTKGGIPELLGGEWSYDNFDTWKRQRTCVESGRYERFLELRLSSQPPFHPFQAAQEDRVLASPVATKRNQSLAESSQHADSVVTQETDKKGLAELHEALQRIPDKAAYLEALQRIPFLVEMESPGIRFLRREDFDAKAAAMRLIVYWRERKHMFGERAFLPMDLSGEGAPNEDDIALVNTKYIAVLPPDQDNHSIVHYDREQIPNENKYSAKSRLRVAFYWLQVLSEDIPAQLDGIVLLNILNTPSFQQSQGIITSGLRLIADAMPMRIYRFHHITRPAAGRRSIFETVLPLVNQALGSYIWSSAIFHIGERKADLLEKLRAHRLSKEGIPELLGGEWSYDDFDTWLGERVVVERARHEKFVEHLLEGKPLRLSPFQDTPETREKALTELENALQLIAEEDKAALLEAREVMPDRVDKEADPIRFLRVEDYNTWAAAQRLVTYWSRRKEIFGKRAFLPMNQTGEGTLSRSDVAALSSGYIAFLPNDSAGRSVLCIDSSKRGSSMSNEKRLRITFYVANIVCENDMTQQDGTVFISIFSKPKLDQHIRKLAELVFNAFPFKLHRHHIVNHIDRSGIKTYTENFVPLMLRLIGHFTEDGPIVHIGNSEKDLADKLEEHELVRENLPRCIGGSWEYTELVEWQDLRMRFEWDLPAGAAHKDSCYDFIFTAKQHCDLTEEEKVERKRRLNVLHSRRKRERRKIEAEVISEQAEQLKEANKKLSEENRQFEEVLEAALAKVAEFESAAATSSSHLATLNMLGRTLSTHSSQQEGQFLAEELLLRESLRQQSTARQAQAQPQSLAQHQQLEQVASSVQHQLLAQTRLASNAHLLEQKRLEQSLRERFSFASYPQRVHFPTGNPQLSDLDAYAEAFGLESYSTVATSVNPPIPAIYPYDPNRSSLASTNDAAAVSTFHAQPTPHEPSTDLLSSLLDLSWMTRHSANGAPAPRDEQGNERRDPRYH